MVSTNDTTEGRKFLSRAFLLEKKEFDSSIPGPASKYHQ